MEASLDDIEYLVRSDHRVGVLDALHDTPRDRGALRSATGASSATVGRILSDFEDRHWIEREGQTYRLTDLGAFVAKRLQAFRDAMELEGTLRDVWPWLPHGIEGFSVELFSDTVVSRPGPAYPLQPIDRIGQLIADSDTIRGFGMMLLKSSNVEAFIDCILDGHECEYVYPPAVFEGLLSWDEERVMEAVTRDNFTVLLHGELPLDERCGICLFGDRVSFCCIDPSTGMIEALVDTAAPEMRSWAESNHRQFRAEADPLEEAEELLSPEFIP